jgi:ribonuclease T2
MPASYHRSLPATLVTLLMFAGIAHTQSQKPKTSNFSYYMLVLSYGPDFCSEPGGDKTPAECGAGKKVGFVVHGMWPQGDTSRGPENCGGSPVSTAIIDATLSYIPTASLIQHEWKTHGTCSGLSAADYFAALRKARDSVKLPDDLNQPSQKLQLSPAQVESKVAAANPSFPATSIRTSCYNDAELQEVRVCLNKDLSPRACGPSAGECTKSSLTLLPVH